MSKSPFSQHEIAGEWNPINDKGPDYYSQGSNKKVWWICNKGHEWEAVIYSRVKGAGCPYCSGRKAGYGNSLLDNDKGKVCRDWNYEKNLRGPECYLPYSGSKVMWICKKGHEWKAKISDRTRGNGCPYCSNKKVGYGNSLADNDKDGICKEWNHEKNFKSPNEYAPISNKKVWWICNRGHEWKALISSRTGSNKSHCPTCNESKGEKQISKYLENKGIKFEKQKKFQSLGRLRYDFFIPRLSLLIEYDGQQHFDPKNYFNQKSSFEKARIRDRKKVVFAAKRGYSMFRISSCMFKYTGETLGRLFSYINRSATKGSLFVYVHHLENSKAKEIYRKQRALFLTSTPKQSVGSE